MFFVYLLLIILFNFDMYPQSLLTPTQPMWRAANFILETLKQHVTEVLDFYVSDYTMDEASKIPSDVKKQCYEEFDKIDELYEKVKMLDNEIDAAFQRIIVLKINTICKQ